MRFNVGQIDPDKVVREVLNKLEQHSLVDGALGMAGVQGLVERRFHDPRRPAAFCLDLIAHSRQGVLHIGDWPVDGNSSTEALRDRCAAILAHMPLSDIRLLGCNTAIKADGRRAMRSLAAIFGTRVWGTKVPISANDFDHNGFCSSGLLADHNDVARFANPRVWRTARWFSGSAIRTRLRELTTQLRAESEAELLDDWQRTIPALRWAIRQYTRSQFEALLDHAEPGMARVPGILAVPDLEIVAPAAPAAGVPRYHRVTLLLDYEVMRVYTHAIPNGCIFRIRRSANWPTALDHGEIIR